MIVTLTPNTGIDYTVAVERFELNATLRARASAWGMGAKATDVAWILGRLGVPVLALGFAAGPNGERMERMLRERGVQTDFVWVQGETRLNIVLVCQDGSGQSTITAPSLEPRAEDVTALRQRLAEVLSGAACLVVGGSLPAGVPLDFYRDVIVEARARDVPVLFDASGPALHAGLQAGPSLIKPNRDEVRELLGFAPVTLAELYVAGRQLRQAYGADVVMTLGREGALAVLADRSYHIPALPVPVHSAAGAGDGVLAGLALALTRGEPAESGLRHGFALAAAVVQTLATADFRPEDYAALLPQVQLIPFPDDEPTI